jgi:molybdenum cofactor cytidylyltransferase
MTLPRFGVAVLAAGLSSRMRGDNKLLRAYRGLPLVAWAGAAARGCQAQVRVLVTGRDGAAVTDAVGADGSWAIVAMDQQPAALSASLRAALEAAGAVDAVCVVLGDMPEIDAALIDRLFAAWVPQAYGVVAHWNGTLGNPVVLGRAAIADCMALTGDRGARALLEANRGRLVLVDGGSAGVLRDLDTPEDFSGVS